MAKVIRDRVMETSTTTGTGDITLAGAVSGFRTFASVCSVADTLEYLIEAVDGSGNPTGEWETGFGTYSAANTLTRTLRQDSSSGSSVNFAAGTKRVSIVATAAASRFRGALVYKAADQTAVNLTTATNITWDTEAYDTDGFHDTGTNTSRITIPTGVSKVRLQAQIGLASVTANMWALLVIFKNGAETFTGHPSGSVEVTINNPRVFAMSPVLDVVAGDYFEARININTSDTSVDINANRSWFAVEVIE